MLTYCEVYPRHYLESGVEKNETQEEGKTETKVQKASYPIGSLMQGMKAHRRQVGHQKEVWTSGLGTGLSLHPLVSLAFRVGTESLPALCPYQ